MQRLEIHISTASKDTQRHKACENKNFHCITKYDTKRVAFSQEEETLKNYIKEVSQIEYGLTRNQFAQVNNKKL